MKTLVSSVTLIVPTRNREARRLRDLVSSLRARGANPQFLIVDYGSEQPFAEQYEALASELGFRLETMHSQGLPWNKSRAINRGVRLAETDYVATSDIDILYDTDPLSYCLAQNRDDACFHVDTYWLDKAGDRRKALPAGHGNPGGFQFIHRSAFEKSGGYDEKIVYWGLEDLDWPARLKRLGYEQVWLPASHRAYHQWHPKAETAGMRPETVSYDSAATCMANLANPVLRQAWGQPLGYADRPILAAMAGGEIPDVVQIPANGFVDYRIFEALLETREGKGYARLELAARLIRRPLDRFRNAAKTLIRPLSAMTGNTIIDKVNYNFDYIYRILPVLYDHGLRDHYVSASLDSVSLLWR